MNIHRGISLWKTPVDKPVENVEKWEFSTGILMFYRSESGCIVP